MSTTLFTFNRTDRHENIMKLRGLLCLWDFDTNDPFTSKGKYHYKLKEGVSGIEFITEGPLSGNAVSLSEGQYLSIPRVDCPALNIHGKQAQVTVLAWIKRHPKSVIQCEAVAGLWNETHRLRQYCLFLNLRIHNSADQVGGHISGVGGPTPGQKYCMDASIGKTPVEYNQWTFAAITYNGKEIRSYHNGLFDQRENSNPYPYEEGIFDGGDKGSDFTVGAVHRSNEMGNHFVGLIGGLAVFDRALSDDEIASIHRNYPLL